MGYRLLQRRELFSILIAFILLFAIGVFSTLDWIQYRQNRNEVTESRQIFEHTATLLSDLTDAETGERGFLLTGDAPYLDPYENVVKTIPRDLATLDRLAASHDPLRRRVDRLNILVAAELAELQRTIFLWKANDRAGSLALMRQGTGKAAMDELRQILRTIITEESDRINRRSVIVRERSDQVHFVNICGSLALLVILGLSGVDIGKGNARREQLIEALAWQHNQTAEVRDLLQTTLSSIGDAVLVSDRHGRVTFLNRVAASLTGWEPEEATNKPVAEVFQTIDEATRQTVNPVGRILAEAGRPDFTGQTILVRRNRGELPIEDVGAPIRTPGGTLLGAVLVFRDISSRLAEEREKERLRASAEHQRSQLYSLFEQAPAIINIHRGPDHIFELVHPRATQLLDGRTLAGLPARTAVPELVEQGLIHLLDEAYRLNRPSVAEELCVRWNMPDGLSREFFVNFTCCPWRDSAGNVAGIMTLAIDVTEQVRIKRERDIGEERLRQAAKLESLGVLAGGIAHDFNNLLVGIMGNASMVLERVPLEGSTRRMLETVVTASERAAALTRQMLAYSGKARFVNERLDVSEIIHQLLPLIEGAVPRTVILSTDLAAHLPAIEGDTSQLEQVFMNLVINAAEAFDGKPGTVRVRTSRAKVDQDLTSAGFGLPELKPGLYVCVEVSDNGCGMDEETRARIFDPFFSTKFTGRGLGLSAVLGIVRAHRGDIKVDSLPDRGSTFRVLLPAGTSPRPVAPPAPAVEKKRSKQSGTILFVDDEALVRELAKSILERSGYKVVLAENGEVAENLFREMKDFISLVVLDLTMPVMSGADTLARLKQIRPDVRVVLSSGFSEMEATRHIDDAALTGFIQKPYTAAGLGDSVRKALTLAGPPA